MSLPRAAAPFVDFAALLRAHGFAAAPQQTATFLAGVGLLGPRGMQDIHRAGLAAFGPPPERREAFDALFRLAFLGQSVPGEGGEGDDEVPVLDARDGAAEPPEADGEQPSGGEATAAERLGLRAFAADPPELLARFSRAVPAALPRRRTRRTAPSRQGRQIDVRRMLREALRRGGEVLTLPRRAPQRRQRPVLLLIDVSGSMKAQTEAHLRLAHALARGAGRMEAFTIGTRLTRITPALRLRHADAALATAGALVADWDGGTRLGEALAAFLGVPRFAGLARGALVIVLSDGLDRGPPSALAEAVAALRRRAFRILWLTPLASGPGFVPQTAALKAAAPFIDRFGPAGTLAAAAAAILDAAA